MHDLAVDQPTSCKDDTFYVDGVDIENCVDCVESHDSEQDKGFVTIHINGKPTEIKGDTGAKCNVMSQETFKHVTDGEQCVKQNKAVNLVAYGGSRLQTTGRVTLPRFLKDQCHSLPFFIVDKDVQPLLGLCACVKMEIIKMSADVHQVTVENNTDFNT